ncbi:MAG: hypothetical protein ACRCY4_10610 [Brevinema sp.]
MRKLYLMLVFSFLSCSTRPVENFFTDLTGSYRLNTSGALFLLRTFPGLGITNADIITADNAGRISYSNTATALVTPLFEISGSPITSRSAVFQVSGQALYFGMELVSTSNLTFSSNLVANPDQAEFFFLLPIASK